MACSLDMFKNELGPRISFSNDFGDHQQQPAKLENSYREAPVSSDFAFSASNFTMISADEIFSKGKILPSREGCTTLRDELLAGDDEGFSPVKGGGSRWRDRLGLKRWNVNAKKSSGKSLGSIDELKIQDIVNHEGECSVVDFKGYN